MVFDRISSALFFWWKNLLPIALISIPFALLSGGVEFFFGPALVTREESIESVNAISSVLILIIQIIAEGALICQLASLYEGRRRSFFDCCLFSLYVFFPLALAMLISSLPLVGSLLFVVAAGGANVTLALLFLAPGLWAYIRLTLAVFYISVERTALPLALKKSIDKTEAIQWPLLLSWLILMSMILMLSTILQGLLSTALDQHGSVTLVASILQKMLGALATVLLFQAYRQNPRPQ